MGTFEVGNLLQKLENLNFCLNFCQVYHTSNALGHVYGCSSQLETIVGTFEIRLSIKIRELFFSLIMEFIMGGSKFFSNFLSVF